MARNKYPDGTHRMWVRITTEAEAELRHLAIDLRADSVEVLAGRLVADGAKAMRAKLKPRRKQADTKR
jgi:hypothetical protein